MALAIRDVVRRDLDAVLALNNGAGPGIVPLDRDAMRRLYRDASYFRVAEVDGHLAGFLIALREQVECDSANYRWFCRHYERFVYIDRVVVASSERGAGLGRVFYCDVQSYAEVRVPLLTCAVLLEPRNDAVLLFHGTYGFNEVAQPQAVSPPQRFSLLVKPLPAFAFVREHYLLGDGLPDVAWLRERDPDRQAPDQLATGTA